MLALMSHRETVELPEDEVVWLTEERVYGILMARGTWFSMVRYSRGGIDYEVLVENDEYIFREDQRD